MRPPGIASPPGEPRRSSSRARPSRAAGAAALALLGALARPVHAQDAALRPVQPEPPPAKVEAFGADPRPLRAAAEEGLLLGISFGLYLVHPSDTAAPDGIYSPGDKLFRGAISVDANKGFTNFAGHPVAGTAYYLIARGNRLPTWLASLYAAGGATTWELIEFHEKASINDLVVTPVAGIALGESAHQLSSFFERRNAGGFDRALSWLFQPVRRFHDRTDGIPGQAGAELPWHRFEAEAAGGAVLRGGAGAAAASVGLSSRIVHGAGYGEAGAGTRALLDGNDTRLAAEMTWGGGRIAEAHLGAHATLVGLYHRDLSEDAGGELHGQDLLLDVGTEFNSDFRDWGGPGRTDWTSLVDVPGAGIAWRLFGGPARFEARLRAALTFGGVLSFPLAADAGAVPPSELGTVTRAYQYYFALGLALAPGIEARLGPVALSAAARIDRLQGIIHQDPAPWLAGPPVPLADSRTTASAAARWDTPLAGLSVDLSYERAWREGNVGDVRRSATAGRALAGATWSF